MGPRMSRISPLGPVERARGQDDGVPSGLAAAVDELSCPGGFVDDPVINGPVFDGIGAEITLLKGCWGTELADTALHANPSARKNNVNRSGMAHTAGCLKAFGAISDSSFLWN